MKPFKYIKSLSASISLPYVFNLILVICVMFFSLHLPAMAQEVVNIPDANLRTVVEKALGKAAGTPITKAEMQTLTSLSGRRTNISNLSGIEAATNLTRLDLSHNSITDISPLVRLMNLIRLDLSGNQLSDLSALAGLTHLEYLYLAGSQLSDTTSLSGLTNLISLNLYSNKLSDITSLSGLTNLISLHLSNNELSDISTLSSLTHLEYLYLSNNQVSDVSPLSGSTNLRNLNLSSNQVSDVSALVGLTNLTQLYLENNQVSDREALAALTAQAVVYFRGNPGFETPGTKIVGPWLWTIVPTGERSGYVAASSGQDFLPEASGGTVTEAHIAENGATAGTAVGDSVWIPGILPIGTNNITALVNSLGLEADINTPVAYGVISVESPREQHTRLYVGNDGSVKVWLNGAPVHVDIYGRYGATDYLTAFPVTLKQGENRLFVAVYRSSSSYPWSGFFGFESGTEYTVPGSEETQEVVNIPDASLRAAIEKALGKSAGAPITKAEMQTLTILSGGRTNISNLSGIEAATNLTRLDLPHNSITDISPLVRLMNLIRLDLSGNQLSDLSALAGLTHLEYLYLSSNQLSDITSLSGLTNLRNLNLFYNRVSDVASLSDLTNLTSLNLSSNQLSDITSLSGLTNLRNLNLSYNRVSDISALAGLTNLGSLYLENNQVSDASALVGLTNLGLLYLENNKVSDPEALAALTAQAVVYFRGNPGFETSGTKIAGPWLWTLVPTGERSGPTAASSGQDFLSKVSGGTVTETSIAENGATAGSAVGESVWTSGILPIGNNNITTLLNTLGLGTDINIPVAYGVISVESPREQQTRLYVGNGGAVKVWLNTELVHVDIYGKYGTNDYLTALPVTLNQGENRLFVAVYRSYSSYPWSGLFGFEDGTEYTVPGSEETQEVVNIPDASLRAAIEKALGKDAGSPITKVEMQTLTTLRSIRTNISNLSGIEALTNLTSLDLSANPISDISPLAELTNLTNLRLQDNRTISDISPLAGLTNLTSLTLAGNPISDFSPLAGLTNLTSLWAPVVQVSDASPLSGLTNLRTLYLTDKVSDISPLAGLTNLTSLYLGNQVSDISPLAGLTNLRTLYLGNQVSDISPLAGLTNLTGLTLSNNQISDISPLSGLTNLTGLTLSNNQISDISPLSGLTNLTGLTLSNNQISDISPLSGLTNLTKVDLANNHVSDRDTLAALTAQTVVYFAGNPAFETPGPKIEGPWLWTLVPTGERDNSAAASSGRDFLSEVSGGTVTEADIAINGTTERTAVGNSVWTSGVLPIGNNNVTELVNTLGLGTDINTPVVYGVISVESVREQNTRLYVGNGRSVKVWLNGASVYVDNSGKYRAGDYLTALPVTLKQGENHLLVSFYKEFYYWSGFFGFEAGTEYTVLEPQQQIQPADVNSNGVVDIQDLILVAANFGETRENPADVNGDGIVNIADLALVAEVLEKMAAGAPALRASALESLSAADVQHWLRTARQANLTEPAFQRGIRFLERLLAALVLKETALLPNYPNPFNPETWIPYQLAEPAAVSISIHSADGKLIRTLALGNQPAGIYQSRSRAAYWDGRNQLGESVASGIYFYTLTARDFTATKKMLIRK